MPGDNTKKAVGRGLVWALIGLLMLVFAVGVHYIREVRAARCDTLRLVAAGKAQFGLRLRLAEVSPARKAMLLAVEDPAFERHHGVDLATPGAGMTTITQGLVKLLYFPEGFHPGIAKIRQALIAQYALDAMVSKEEQLLVFLNICYLGNVDGRSVHGYADAAETYFGKKFSALTDDEFLALVAMHIGPNALKPGTTANAERVQRIKMYLSGRYRPDGLLDVEYRGKRRGTVAEEGLIALLRLLTAARPDEDNCRCCP